MHIVITVFQRCSFATFNTVFSFTPRTKFYAAFIHTVVNITMRLNQQLLAISSFFLIILMAKQPQHFTTGYDIMWQQKLSISNVQLRPVAFI